MNSTTIESRPEIEPGPFVTKKLTVFYFGSMEGGTGWPHAVGTDDSGDFWIALAGPGMYSTEQIGIDPNRSRSDRIDCVIKDLSRFDFIERDSSFRVENFIPYRQMMDGRTASQFSRYDACYAGMGHYGICVGQLDVRTRTQAWREANFQAHLAATEAQTHRCIKCDGKKEVLAGWDKETGNRFVACPRCKGTGLPPSAINS